MVIIMVQLMGWDGYYGYLSLSPFQMQLCRVPCFGLIRLYASKDLKSFEVFERQKTKHLSRYLEDQGSAPHHLRSPACCFPSGPATYFAPLPAWPSVTWVTGRLHGGGPTVRLTKNNGFLIKTWLVNLSK